MRRFAHAPLTAAVLLALLAARPAVALSLVVNRTLLVAAVGTPAENCADLRQALAGIDDASASNPYLVQLEPGVYGCAADAVVMKPFVDLQGAGRDVTRVETAAGVHLAASTELRHLTVVANGSSGFQCALFATGGGEPRVSHVRLEASGSFFHCGVHQTDGASPVLRDVEIVLDTPSSGAVSSGIYASGNAAGWLDGVTIRLEGAAPMEFDGTGIDAFGEDTQGAIRSWRIRNTTIEVRGHQQTAGLRFINVPGGPTLEEVRIEAVDGLDQNFAIHLINTPATVRRSVLTAGGGGAHHDAIHNEGALVETPVHQVVVTHSTLTGPTHTLHNDADFLSRLGGSRLAGGPVENTAGSLTCAGVWDESATFFASTCP